MKEGRQYLYSYLRKRRQGSTQGFLFFYDYYDDLWMSVVYENYTAAYSSSSNEVESCCILDRYIYIHTSKTKTRKMYIKNKHEKNRRIVTTFGGVLRQRILNIQTSGIYIYIFQFLHLQRKPPQQAYLPPT